APAHAPRAMQGLPRAGPRPGAAGEPYFLSGDEMPTPDEMMGLIADAVGVRGMPVPLPAWAIRAAGRLAEVARDLAGISLIFDRWKAEALAIGNWAFSNRPA